MSGDKRNAASMARWEAAAACLVTGRKIGQTAERIGVNRRTIERWLDDPEFVALVNARRQELWGSLYDRVRSLVEGAIGLYEAKIDSGSFDAARDVIRIWGPTIGQGLAVIGSPDAKELRRQRRESDELAALGDLLLDDDEGGGPQ